MQGEFVVRRLDSALSTVKASWIFPVQSLNLNLTPVTREIARYKCYSY